MLFPPILPLLLGVASIPAAFAKVYTDTSNVPQFLEYLSVGQGNSTRISDLLNGYDARTISNLSPAQKASLACKINKVARDGRYYDSSVSNYLAVSDEHWSSTCWLSPLCIIEPSSASEVSRAIQIVAFTGAKFSVRGGGHNPNPGWASNNGGVLIDLAGLNEISLSSDGSYVSVGSGNRWEYVYDSLDKSNKSAVGGRVTNVGVGGYLLGGGLGRFSSHFGLAATHVRNYEIVLSNGSVVDANLNTNTQLFTALRGGGSNFGIVTRYDIETVENNQVWYEGHLYDPSQASALLSAATKYSVAAENDDKADLTVILTDQIAQAVFFYNSPVRRPDVFSMFYNITSTQTVFNSTISSRNKMLNATSSLASIAPGRRLIGAASTKFDSDTLQEGFASFLDLTAQAEKAFNGSLAYVLQPVTRSAVQKSSLNGGNILGLSDVTQNWLSYSVEWPSSSQDGAVLTVSQRFENGFNSIAQKRGSSLPYLFMNDAGFNQNVLASYGQDSLSKMRSVSQTYDPYQVFQELQNDGFLLRKL